MQFKFTTIVDNDFMWSWVSVQLEFINNEKILFNNLSNASVLFFVFRDIQTSLSCGNYDNTTDVKTMTTSGFYCIWTNTSAA